jgi:Mg2+-importing ATPase
MTEQVVALSRLEPGPSCAHLGSRSEGLTAEEAAERLEKHGPNLVTRERKPTILQELWGRARNPPNALLLTLATVSYFLGDVRAAVTCQGVTGVGQWRENSLAERESSESVFASVHRRC